MILVRNLFVAKAGQAGRLAAQLKDIAGAGELRNVRVLTDLVGDFNHVVMEHEVDTMAEFEAVLQRYATDPIVRQKAKGYTDLWLTGKRELFRLT